MNKQNSRAGEIMQFSINTPKVHRTYTLYKLEQPKKDDPLIDVLNNYIKGKWEVAIPAPIFDTKFNFKENRSAVKYDKVSQSSKGNWYWTYKEEGNTIKCYL